MAPANPSLPERVYRTAVNALDRITLVGADDRPVFVGGCPRSGTTLVRTMLHAHPELAIPRETKFLMEAWWRRQEFGDLRAEQNRARLADWLMNEVKLTQFRRLELDLTEARARMLAAPPTMGSILGTAFQMFSERHGAKRWGDKRPMYIVNLPTIMGLFPDVQFINVVRDPRAVVASMRKLGWLDDWSEGTVVGGVERWLRSIAAGYKAQRRYRDDQFLEFRYEDLIADPGTELKRVCAFTGLAEEGIGAMLLYHEKADEIPDKQKEKFHPLIAQPLTAEPSRGWTSQLAQEEVAFIEKVTVRAMRRYGYEPVASGVPIPDDLERRWAERWTKRRRTFRWPRVRTIAYPHPIAARLTKSQRRRASVLSLRGKR